MSTSRSAAHSRHIQQVLLSIFILGALGAMYLMWMQPTAFIAIGGL